MIRQFAGTGPTSPSGDGGAPAADFCIVAYSKVYMKKIIPGFFVVV
jgi:hypothetical protein